MSDPFGEHDASITPIRPTLDEIDKVVNLANQSTGLTVHETIIPTDSVPFNQMAAYFGAAGTILNRLQNRGKDFVAISEFESEVRSVWGSNGEEFCAQVVSIVVKYFENHVHEQCAWAKATDERYRLLQMGFDGYSSLECAGVRDPETRMILRRNWFPHAQE